MDFKSCVCNTSDTREVGGVGQFEVWTEKPATVANDTAGTVQCPGYDVPMSASSEPPCIPPDTTSTTTGTDTTTTTATRTTTATTTHSGTVQPAREGAQNTSTTDSSDTSTTKHYSHPITTSTETTSGRNTPPAGAASDTFTAAATAAATAATTTTAPPSNSGNKDSGAASDPKFNKKTFMSFIYVTITALLAIIAWKSYEIWFKDGRIKAKQAYRELLVNNEAYDVRVDDEEGDSDRGFDDNGGSGGSFRHYHANNGERGIIPASETLGAVQGKSARSMPKWSRADSDGIDLLSSDFSEMDDLVFSGASSVADKMPDFAEPEADGLAIGKEFVNVDLSSHALLQSIDE